MADMFAMKAPLMIRLANGEKRIMVEYFRHADGLLFFNPFWHQNPQQGIHVVQGEYKGDGPWKVGNNVIHVLGCRGSDPELANLYAEWQFYLQTCADEYPSTDEICSLAKARGALIATMADI